MPERDRGKVNRKSRGEKLALGVLIGVYFLLALAYSVITPIFEASDELWHYPFVSHLAKNWTLPVQDPANPGLWRQEGSQPPLYYYLTAAFTAPASIDDLDEPRHLNPNADMGVLTEDGNVNMAIHGPEENFPYHGLALGVHWARLLSVLLGAVTVWATYHICREILPGRRGIGFLTTAFVAFNPMFLFLSGSVNNDNASNTFATLAVLLLLRAMRRPERQRLIALGLVCGIAALSKASGVGLLPLVILGLSAACFFAKGQKIYLAKAAATHRELVLAALRQCFRPLSKQLGWTLLPAALLCGWWYLRNRLLYGEWLGFNRFVAMVGGRNPRPDLVQLAAEWKGFFMAYWGFFGGVNVAMPDWVYNVYSVLCFAAAAGLLYTLARKLAKAEETSQSGDNKTTWWLRSAQALVIVAWPTAVFIGLVRWTLQTIASQGRLMFPAIACLSMTLAYGLVAWLPRYWHKWLAAALSFGLLTLAAWAPIAVIAPAYAQPKLLSPLERPEQELNLRLGESIRLVGYDTPISVISPGESITLALYWQALAPMDKDYTVFIHLLDDNDIVIAQRDVYHGPGTFPTSLWRPVNYFADRYTLTVPKTTPAPLHCRLEVGVYDRKTGQRLQFFTTSGKPWNDNIRFGNIYIVPNSGGLPNNVEVTFAKGLVLVGYELDKRVVYPGENLRLHLWWRAGEDGKEDYVLFTHVYNSAGMWGQKDAPPQPGTGSWKRGDLIESVYDIRIRKDAPPGVHELEIGWYRPSDGERLPLLGEGGHVVDTRLVLGRIRVAQWPESILSILKTRQP